MKYMVLILAFMIISTNATADTKKTSVKQCWKQYRTLLIDAYEFNLNELIKSNFRVANYLINDPEKDYEYKANECKALSKLNKI